MSNVLRRFEILLPLRFNDRTKIASELGVETVQERRQRFGAVSCETQIIQGVWQHAGENFRDELARLFVDVPDLPEHREFMTGYKEKLKVRFRQIDIWMVTFLLDVI